jgi:hypothetical protein
MTSTGRGLTRLLLASLFAIAIAVAGFAAPVRGSAIIQNATHG